MAEVHISGGEPLILPDIERQIGKMVAAGISCTVTTNGMLILKRRALLEMPLKWIVTHHDCNPYEKWRRNADLIADKPHLVCRLLTDDIADNRTEYERMYEGMNFVWGKLWGLRECDATPNPADVSHVSTHVLHLIETDGRVYPCSVKSFSIGNIHDMSYDIARAGKINGRSRRCVISRRCSAYQTALISAGLAVDIPGE